jgi:hypothetical protein
MVTAPHPNNRRARLSDDDLRDGYVRQGRTLHQVAQGLGVSPTTVRRRLRDLGIPARRRGPSCTLRVGRVLTAWSPDVAYAVGLIATDGNLARDGRHLTVSSKDVDLLEGLRRCLILKVAITRCTDTKCYHVQWSDRGFYEWLVSIGLMPAKSLCLGPLAVPDDVFRDFLRGCIDGDGSIVTYVDRFNTKKNSKYVYDRLFVSIVSASPHFLPWIQASVQRLCGVSGHLTVRQPASGNPLWCLRWAKRESVTLLRWIYYAADVPALRRKRERAERALVGATWYRHLLPGATRDGMAGVE